MNNNTTLFTAMSEITTHGIFLTGLSRLMGIMNISALLCAVSLSVRQHHVKILWLLNYSVDCDAELRVAAGIGIPMRPERHYKRRSWRNFLFGYRTKCIKGPARYEASHTGATFELDYPVT